MALPVHYFHPPAPEYLEYMLPKLLPEIHISTDDESSIPGETQILIAGRPKREMLLSAPGLRTLIIPWAGIPAETRQLMLDYPDIRVHNLHHNAGPAAELALGLLLAAAKFILPFDRSLRSDDWRPRYRPTPAFMLEGKTALILGYGSIGRRIAAYCRGLGMRVLATRRRLDVKNVTEDEIHPQSALPRLLPKANVLLICLPLTSETEGLIGKDELNLLPDDAVLVNVGRGPIVEEKALYQALRDGRLHGAGLDVWYNYPPDEDSWPATAPANFPFHELDNVVMSPHRAGFTKETNYLRMDSMATMLNKAARGESLPNQVDIQAGY